MSRVGLISICVLALLAACEPADYADNGGEGNFGIKLLPASSTCSGNADPVAMGEIGITVVDPSVTPAEVLASDSFGGSKTKISLSVPEGKGLELSVLGWSQDDEPVPLYIARARSVTVQADKTTQLKLSLNRLGGFSCVDTPSSAPNLMFPSTTALPDGRVLVTGGYTKVADNGDRFEILGATNKAYIFDPATNGIRQINKVMNLARGAHSAIYLPQKQQVLIVGGSERLFYDKTAISMPLYFEKGKVGAVGATYELFDTITEEFIPYSAWPDETTRLVYNKNRVMPILSLNTDGTVLVTGGGMWPTPKGAVETDTDYRYAEIYRPQSPTYSGGFQDTDGALAMTTLRTGHASALLEVKDKLSYHLFFGGNMEGAVAEIYQESSGQLDGNWGLFKPVSFLDGTSYSKKPYFATLTPLSSRRFLLAGGLHNANGKLKTPSSGDTYLVIADSTHRLDMEQISGLTVGRYLHSAGSWDAQHVAIFGGLTSEPSGEDTVFSINATGDIRVFDLKAKAFMNITGEDPANPRAGHGTTLLPNDCFLFVGGVEKIGENLQNGSFVPGLSSDIYCPSVLCPSGLWDAGCYQE
jgi:hypothetical protein